MIKKIGLLLLFFILICSLSVSSWAWLGELFAFNFPPVSGTAEVAYFESGNGTAENPYVISNSLHVYNLAWLQYIGYFNLGSANNKQAQSYFVLKNDIDMGGLTIPPIGTTEYPFIGHFSGGENIIYNFNVANASDAFERRPGNAQFNATNSLLSHFADKYDTGEVGNVMGFFGVVGGTDKYQDDYASANATFSKGNILVEDLGIANYTLESDSTKTTVGMIAGYVNATLDNVLAGNCTLTTKENAEGAENAATISTHTLVGYCDADFATALNASEFDILDPKIGTPQEDINGVGTGANWGGSIAMDDLHRDLLESVIDEDTNKPITYGVVHSLDTAVTTSSGVTTTGDPTPLSREDFVISGQDVNKFSVVLSPRSLLTYGSFTDTDGRYLCLAGGYMNTVTYYESTGETLTGYTYHSGNNYLNLNAAGNGLTVGTASNATVWIMEAYDNTYSYFYTIKDGVNYYLIPSFDGECTVSTLKSTTYANKWSFTNNNLAGRTFSTTYMYLSGGAWTMSTSKTSFTRDNEKTYEIKNVISSTSTYQYKNDKANGYVSTYIPLQMNYSGNTCLYTPSSQNTGYITSGLYDALSSGGFSEKRDDGDIRVSKYYTKNISDQENVLTVRYVNGKYQFVKIPTSNYENDGNYTALNLQRYSKAVTEYNDLFKNTTSLYGLHFMSGNISTDSLVTVPNASIYGTGYENYELPGDCIDFTVKSDGYITFFAGGYFPDNNCFFSLHQITRYKEGDTIPEGKKVNDIKEIKEISQIYNLNGSYIYLYGSDSAPDGATLVFDSAWLKNPTNMGGWVNQTGSDQDAESLRGAAYYFEIPVSAGEYALGSVNGTGKIGAYLLYLDIGASLQDASMMQVNRTVVHETFIDESLNDSYANGIGVLKSELVEGNNYTSTYHAVNEQYFSATLAADYGTNMTLLRTDDTVTLSATSAAAAKINAERGLTTQNGANVSFVGGSGGGGARVVTKRVTYFDDNLTSGANTRVIVTLVFTDSDGDTLLDSGETYKVTITDGAGTPITGTNIETADGKTTFRLSYRVEDDIINWNDGFLAGTTVVLRYSYKYESGEVTHTPTFTLNEGDTKLNYIITVSSTDGVTLTEINYYFTDSTTAAGGEVEAGANATLPTS